jgi:hypothetical protein
MVCIFYHYHHHKLVFMGATLTAGLIAVGEGAILVKEASHIFRVSATGRINTPGLLAYLEVRSWLRCKLTCPQTKKRQDLLSFALATFGQIYPNYDQIVSCAET